MSALLPHYLTLLEKTLGMDFVPLLPPLLDSSPPIDQQNRKNMSRAFSAFVLHRLCKISPNDAAHAVIDDFDDFGVDAIYYHAPSETVYLVQAKLKASELFSQAEALAFCQGIRKLIRQDFTEFNTNVQKRVKEIEDAVENCSRIQLVVAHTGSGISHHAKAAVQDLLDDEDHGEERFAKPVLDYDAERVVTDLHAAMAYKHVNTDIWLQKCESIREPRVTYFGLAHLDDLVKLHRKHGEALYERNIRTFLGHKTDVNISIRQTLAEKPEEFLFLNNGVAALCQGIEPKGTTVSRGRRKKLKIRGFSVINGAQTIASAARFLEDNHEADITKARVALTLIKATADGEFGKAVTRARNHQNPVSFSNFVALDDEQERLRRELAYLSFRYVYKAEAIENKSDLLRIPIDEAAQALALFHPDPRVVVLLKKEPGRLLDSGADLYRALFNNALTPFQLVNAVHFFRYIQRRMIAVASAAMGQERLTYKHGNYVLGWTLAKRIRIEQQATRLIDEAKLETTLSAPVDTLREMLWAETQKMTLHKGPLSLFKSQTDVVPLLEIILIQNYGLGADVVVDHKRKEQKASQPYPQELFSYLISRAPQIGNLS